MLGLRGSRGRWAGGLGPTAALRPLAKRRERERGWLLVRASRARKFIEAVLNGQVKVRFISRFVSASRRRCEREGKRGERGRRAVVRRQLRCLARHIPPTQVEWSSSTDSPGRTGRATLTGLNVAAQKGSKNWLKKKENEIVQIVRKT